MSAQSVEIERKYIIRMPGREMLLCMEEYTESEITQIYIESDDRITHRVRSRVFGDNIQYTETRKIRIDKMSAFEDERTISSEEFYGLAEKMKKNTRPVIKKRCTFIFESQLFEIDIYPEWKNTAILETELKSREEKVNFPDFIEIIEDVTGDGRYSNASMASLFPEEKEI